MPYLLSSEMFSNKITIFEYFCISSEQSQKSDATPSQAKRKCRRRYPTRCIYDNLIGMLCFFKKVRNKRKPFQCITCNIQCTAT
jgi:hypothetical protein